MYVNMSKKITQLQKNIMRRVYYAYTLRMVFSLVTAQMMLFVAALYVFAQTVFVAKVIQNLLDTPLGSLPRFVFDTFMHGEALTLIAIGVMTFVGLSLGLRVPQSYA